MAGGAVVGVGVFWVELGVEGTLGEDRDTGLTPTAAEGENNVWMHDVTYKYSFLFYISLFIPSYSSSNTNSKIILILILYNQQIVET